MTLTLYNLTSYGALVLLPYFIFRLITVWRITIPGPLLCKLTSLYFDYHMVRGQSHLFIHELHQKYGSIVQFAPDRVSAIDRDDVNEIYKSYKFRKSPFYRCLDFGGSNLGTFSDREGHTKRKKILMKFFGPDNRDYIAKVVEEMGASLFDKKLSEIASDSKTCDLNHLIHEIYYHISGNVVFGEAFRRITDETDSNFLNWLRPAQVYCILVYMFPLLKLVGNWIGERTYISLLSFCQRMIDESNRLSLETKECSSLSLLLNHRDPDDGSPMLECDIRAELVTQLMASADTVLTALNWFFLTILHRPNIMKTIVNELDEAFPNRDNPITADIVEKQCPYLVATLLETLRMYPPASGYVPRMTPIDGAHLSGHFLPPNTECGINLYAYHHSPLHWSNPDHFHPDRFLGPKGQSLRSTLQAFSSGPTGCAGREIAWLEMYLLTATVLRKFTFTSINPTTQAPSHTCFLILKPHTDSISVNVTSRY